MPLYGGIDLHANNSVIVLLNEQDEVIYRKQLLNELPTIIRQLGPYQMEMEGLVVESTYNWYAQFIAVCSGLRLNYELRISDPVQR